MQGRQICYPQNVFRLDLEQVKTRLFKKLHRVRHGKWRQPAATKP